MSRTRAELVRPTKVTDAILVSSNVPETEYTAWAAGVTYADGAFVRLVATDVHKIYQSAQADNVGHDPQTDDGTWWIDAGSTNRWAMFDESVQSQTTAQDSLEVSLRSTGVLDTLALLNVSGASVSVTLTDPSEGVVLSETYSLVSNAGIDDWWKWFFEPITRKTDLLIPLPPYAGALLDVAIDAPGETAACGVMIVGLSKEIGGTQLGASVGIQDYSRKGRDDFGNAVVVERAYSRRANLSIVTDNTAIDALLTLLAQYRATPVLYIGTSLYSSTIIYGFYRDLAIEIQWPEQSLLNLEVEGLT